MPVALLTDRALGRVLSGHPWIYLTDILRIDQQPRDGEEIMVRTAKGAYVGHGFYNSKSRIPIRIYSRNKESLNEDTFKKRIEDAVAFRSRLFEVDNPFRMSVPTSNLPEVCRLFWSEADFLPGLIVDRYGDVLVIQTLTLAMDQRREIIKAVLRERFQPRMILERNDVPSRAQEGLDLNKGIGWGEGKSTVEVMMGRVRMQLDLLEGQKTGSYLDQTASHIAVAAHAQNRRVLDCFTYQGGFALHAANAGAASVTGVDISEAAIDRCRQNAIRNGLTNVTWSAKNVFDDLNTRQRSSESFDLVILDPPSFTKTRAKLDDALRGYKEIHLRAFKLLSPGGLLATFCCSHHVDTQTFRDVILDAAFDARKVLRLRQVYAQSWDHPVLPAVPETEYLKGYLFEVVS